jgi:hypothetical protein
MLQENLNGCTNICTNVSLSGRSCADLYGWFVLREKMLCVGLYA